MKKICKIMTFILAIITLIPIINAEELCKGQEKLDISKEAASIKATYEEQKEQKIQKNYNDASDENDTVVITKLYFDVIFMNITNNIRIQIKNENTKETFDISFSQTNNGVYKIRHDNLYKVTTYSYKVYGSFDSKCFQTQLKSGRITIPARNPFAVDPMCDGYEDYSACQEYVNFDTDTTDIGALLRKEIAQKEKVKEKEDKKSKTSIITKIKNYIESHRILLLIIGSTLIIIIIALIIIKMVQRRKRIL